MNISEKIPSIKNSSQFKTKAAQFFAMGAASFALASFSSTAIIPVAIAGGAVATLILAGAGYKCLKNSREKNKIGIENMAPLAHQATTEQVADSIQAIRDKMSPNNSNSNKPKNQIVL